MATKADFTRDDWESIRNAPYLVGAVTMLDQEKIGIPVRVYQSRSASRAGPLMVTQPGHGSVIWSASEKFGLLTANGTCPDLAA